MKKRWLFLFIPCAALFLVIGIWLGTKMDVEQLNKQNNFSSDIKSTIAVVNQDAGVKNKGANINYSEAFISSLNNDYKVVSYKEAQDGMDNGKFSAIVTFPSDLSNNVYSLNDSTLQSPKIEFVVNPALIESAYIETYLKVLDLQNEMNKSISFLYVSSVFDEFHDAQDKVKEIFKNDDDDMTALSSVKLHDFRLNVNWSDIPQVEFNPTEINFDEFVASVQKYADNMSEKYLDSYAMAQSDYEKYQKDFSSMAQQMSSVGTQWYKKVNEREKNVTQYASSVMSYSDDVTLWGQNVHDWNNSTNKWLSGISLYLNDINLWKDNIASWKNATEHWSDNYESSLNLYKEGLNNYSDNVYNHYLCDTDEWASSYTQYRDDTEALLGNIQTLVCEYNSKVDIDNTYASEVTNFSNELLKYYANTKSLPSDLINQYYEPMKSYHTALKEGYFGSNTKVGLVEKINNYYCSVEAYEMALNTYKDELEDYIAEYDSQLNDYWKVYWMQCLLTGVEPDPSTMSKPELDLEDLHGSLESNYNFSTVKDGIQNLSNSINDSCEEQNRILDTAKNNLDQTIRESSDRINELSLTAPPVQPEYSGLPNDGVLEKINDDALDEYIHPDLPQWNSKFEAPPLADAYITDETRKAPQVINDFDKIAPEFNGTEFEEFSAVQPKNIEASLPILPTEFTDGCNGIVDESAKYVPENYLTNDVRSQVNSIVGMYAANLESTASGLKNNLISNNNLLLQAYGKYNSYVGNLRSDANTAYINKENDLVSSLEAFYNAKENTSKENKELLEDFSEKLPNSRTNSVTNKNLVDFTVSPVDIVSGDIRHNEQSGASLQEKRLETYSFIIIIVSAIVAAAILIILIMYIKDSRSRRKKL